MKGRIDELSKQLNLNTVQTVSAKEQATEAKANADTAKDMAQTALVNLPTPHTEQK